MKHFLIKVAVATLIATVIIAIGTAIVGKIDYGSYYTGLGAGMAIWIWFEYYNEVIRRR